MSDVTDLNDKRVAVGETVFMQCPCVPGMTDFIPVVVAEDPPLLISLLCPECQTELPVVNGYVETGDE